MPAQDTTPHVTVNRNAVGAVLFISIIMNGARGAVVYSIPLTKRHTESHQRFNFHMVCTHASPCLKNAARGVVHFNSTRRPAFTTLPQI